MIQMSDDYSHSLFLKALNLLFFHKIHTFAAVKHASHCVNVFSAYLYKYVFVISWSSRSVTMEIIISVPSRIGCKHSSSAQCNLSYPTAFAMTLCVGAMAFFFFFTAFGAPSVLRKRSLSFLTQDIYASSASAFVISPSLLWATLSKRKSKGSQLGKHNIESL